MIEDSTYYCLVKGGFNLRKSRKEVMCPDCIYVLNIENNFCGQEMEEI